MGSITVAHALTLSFRVTSFGEGSMLVIVSLVWALLWILLFIDCYNANRIGHLALLLFWPMLFFLIMVNSGPTTSNQIVEAKKKGYLLLHRLNAYEEALEAYPRSLSELEHFDGLAIPETGIGFGGDQEFHYSPPWDTDEMTVYFHSFGGSSYHISPEEDWWYWD